METGRPTWRSRAWLVAGGVLVVLALALGTVGVGSPTATAAMLMGAAVVSATTVGWALLRTRAQRRRHETELAAWSAERATQAERLRIAAELHDLVSHGLGLITVRAAVARTLTGSLGQTEPADALADIEHVSRETTTELRRMLAVLRTPGAAPRRPAENLDDLEAIATSATATGVRTTLVVGKLGAVSSGVQLTICAVVREALNNVIRHAGPTQASVGVRRDGHVIVVDIRDAGPGEPWQPQPGAGHGMDGLRERLAALGGTLHAEPDGHGFRVTARIPDRRQS